MLLRQSALYLIANGLAAALGFASVVVLTRVVAPAEYGVFVVVMSLGTVLATCFFTWQRHAILRFQSERDADVRLSMLIGYILTLALHPLAFLFLTQAVQVPFDKALAAVLVAAAGTLFEHGQEILRAQQRVHLYVRGSLMRSAASFAFCLLAVWLDAGGMALVAAVIGGYLVTTLLSARAIWQRPLAAPRRDTLLRLAAYGLPITISGVFVAATLALDRFVLYAVLGTEAVGVYGATADFVRQCAILPAISASLAIAPLAVAHLGREDGAATARHLADGAELLLAVMLPAAVGLAIAAPQIAGSVFGEAYRENAAGLIPWLACAFLAHSMSQQLVQLSFGLAEKPRLYVIHTASIFFLNLLAIIPLVKHFGPVGAAASFLFSEVAGVAIGLWMTRLAYPLPRIDARVWRIVAAVAIMAVACFAAQAAVARTDALGLAAVIAAGVLSYGFAAAFLNVVRLRPLALDHLSPWTESAIKARMRRP